MSKQYSALCIAKYFLYKSNGSRYSISNKKLQKLLYYAQAWHTVFKDKPLFKDTIEAWIHGPAIRSVYNEYKKFGFFNINNDINLSDIECIKEDTKTLLDDVWKIYGKYDANYLEQLTHSETPWQDARGALDAEMNSTNEINIDSIKSYYKSLLESVTK